MATPARDAANQPIANSMQPSRTQFGRLHLSAGRTYISDLLDLIAATDGSVEKVSDAVTHLYDWQNSRFLAGLQLSIAPAAAAVLAIVAKPNSTLVLAIGAGVLLLAVVAGLIELGSLVWLNREYIYAMRLATRLGVIRSDFAPYPHGVDAPTGSLYEEIGHYSIVQYRKDANIRLAVVGAIESRFEALSMSSKRAV